jgi:uncharacterized membrane protein YdjX (TVP38/TMEM64 family)
MKLKPLSSLNRKQLLKAIVPALILIGALIAVLVIWGVPALDILMNPEKIRTAVASKGVTGILLYLVFQIVQIVIAIIPGEPIQIAGGYLFGTWNGFLLSTAGIMLGSVIAFLISKFFGLPVVRLFVRDDQLASLKFRLESQKSLAVIALLSLIPGVPKDILVYAAGLTPIRFELFFLIYFFGRLPALFAASFMGAQLGRSNWPVFLAVGALGVVILGLCVRYREKMARLLKIH